MIKSKDPIKAPDIRMMQKPGKVKRDVSADTGAHLSQITTPQSTRVNTPQGDLDTEITPAEADPTMKKTVVDEYLQFLEENDVSKEDIFKVLDSLITTNNVYWSFDLLGKIPVVFRMRPAWVSQLVMSAVESINPKMFPHFNDIVCTQNLAGSLESYGDTKFKMDNQDDFAVCLKFVRGLGFVLQNRLTQQLAIFDRVLAVATSDWAVNSFTGPQSEE
jgi:hypothetical protein